MTNLAVRSVVAACLTGMWNVSSSTTCCVALSSMAVFSMVLYFVVSMSRGVGLHAHVILIIIFHFNNYLLIFI